MKKNSQDATQRDDTRGHTPHNHKQLITCSSRDRFMIEYDEFFVRQATSGRTHRSVARNTDATTPPDCYPCRRCSLATFLGCQKVDTNWLWRLEAPRCHEAAAWIFIPPGGIKSDAVESKSRKISFIPWGGIKIGLRLEGNRYHTTSRESKQLPVWCLLVSSIQRILVCIERIVYSGRTNRCIGRISDMVYHGLFKG